MTKFIDIHEKRSQRGIDQLMRQRARPLGGNFEEPFAEDNSDYEGEDDGLQAQAATPEPETPAALQDITWIRNAVCIDVIGEVKELIGSGLSKSLIIKKNAEKIYARETYDEVMSLIRSA